MTAQCFSSSPSTASLRSGGTGTTARLKNDTTPFPLIDNVAWFVQVYESVLGVVSGQVLSEFHWTVARKLKPGLDDEQARRHIRTLFAWEFVAVDQAATSEAWGVQDRFGFSFWDALVVAAARIGGCRVLLTEDLQDGQDLDGLLVVNPFIRPPGSLSTETDRTRSRP